MVELLAVGVLALHGIVCSMILVVYLWRAARLRESGWPMPSAPAAPDKLEPPDLAGFEVESYPAPEIFAVMRDYFPAEYERYRSGRLGYIERRWTWDACCSILEARAEIEELCS